MMHESMLYEENCFLTMTYDDQNLPINLSINKEDIQNFLKRLRNDVGFNKIRYFACGEYGDDLKYNFRGQYGGNLGRPHYHALIFNYWPEDTFPYTNKNGYPIYTSKKLNDIWSYGDVYLGTVTFDSAQYVAKYVTKRTTPITVTDDYGNKYKTDANVKKWYGDCKPEFALMSRRPGIGIPWLERYYNDTVRDGYIVANNVQMSIPQAYKTKLREKKLKLYESNDIKEAQKIHDISLKLQEINDKNKIEDHFEEHAYFQQVNRYNKSKFEMFDRSIL